MERRVQFAALVVGALFAQVALVAQPALAQDGAPADDWGGDDSALGGDDFGFASAATPTEVAVPPPAPREQSWHLGGFVRSDWGVWAERLGGASGFDEDALAKARQSLDLWLRWKSGRLRAQISGHHEFDPVWDRAALARDAPTWREYASLTQVRESYVAASLGAVELTVGRQIVAWGEGDMQSPLDVVNPRDMREPGLADLVDLRLPVLATRAGWFHGNHTVEAIVVHEANFGLRATPMGPFSPLPALLLDNDTVRNLGKAGIDVEAQLRAKEIAWQHGFDDASERYGADAQQLFVRWLHRGEGLDLGLYLASALDQQGAMDPAGFGDMAALLMAERIDLPLQHRRFTLAGTSGAWVNGSWLLKWELALVPDKRFNTGDTSALPPKLEVTERAAVAAMAGLTWKATSTTTVGVEIARTTLIDAPADLIFPVDAPMLAGRLMHRAVHDRLIFVAAASAFGLQAEYGWLARGEVRWDFGDGVQAGVGAISYQPGDEFGPLAGLDRHDRVFGQLRWDFQAR